MCQGDLKQFLQKKGWNLGQLHEEEWRINHTLLQTPAIKFPRRNLLSKDSMREVSSDLNRHFFSTSSLLMSSLRICS